MPLPSKTASTDLSATCPDWAKIVRSFPGGFEIEARPRRASGSTTRPYTLRVSTDPASGKVTVQEFPESRILPKACPQRHINVDGSFCIGLRAGYLVEDRSSAANWCRNSAYSLRLKRPQKKSGNGPPLLQLSHGDAADIQLKAEMLADRLGKAEDYKNAVAFGIRPVAVYARQIRFPMGRLKNSGAKCVCGWIRSDGQTKKRWQCAKDNDLCLPVLEAKRQRAEKSFWRHWEGLPCCGTMRECPLALDR